MSSGRRSIAALLVGTASGQGLLLLAAPVLSRLYSPSDFGVFVVLSGVVALLGTVAALRFELAIPLPTADEDAYALVALGIFCSVCGVVVALVVIGVAGRRIAELFGGAAIVPWLWLIPLIAGAMGIYTLFSQLAIRSHRYTAIARRSLLQSIGVSVTQILAGLSGFVSGGLIVGLAVGQLTSALALGLGAGLRSPAAKMGMTFERLRSVAKRYRAFPLMLAPAGLINVAGMQVPILMIAYWYGADVAGWLGMTQRVLALPVMLVGTAAAQVYLGTIAEIARVGADNIKATFYQASRRLLLAGLLVGLGAASLGPLLFPLVLGSQWSTSGLYAQALSAGLAAQMVAVPVSQTLIVLGHTRLQLCWDIARLISTSGAVVICRISGGSALAAVWSVGLVMGATYIASWLLSRSKVANS